VSEFAKLLLHDHLSYLDLVNACEYHVASVAAAVLDETVWGFVSTDTTPTCQARLIVSSGINS
jgi:hypothetical protein